jgi:glycosyltransferase involved in cell wall biosynthesis
MKISIITPSFNQGRFIKDTIESVLRQNYSDLEHIIVDGGSTDQTLDVIRSYNHLRWISEKDKGPANALNKGFKMATGEIITWLNADDYYNPLILQEVIENFGNGDYGLVYGKCIFVDEFKNELFRDENINYDINILLNYYPDIIRQPSTFFRKSLLDEVGGLDESLKCVFDYDLFIRMVKKTKAYYLDKYISFVRDYKDTITRRNIRKQGIEILKVSRRNGGRFFSRLVYRSLMRKILFP